VEAIEARSARDFPSDSQYVRSAAFETPACFTKLGYVVLLERFYAFLKDLKWHRYAAYERFLDLVTRRKLAVIGNERALNER
jgi:hypothetical protein